MKEVHLVPTILLSIILKSLDINNHVTVQYLNDQHTHSIPGLDQLLVLRSFVAFGGLRKTYTIFTLCAQLALTRKYPFSQVLTMKF